MLRIDRIATVIVTSFCVVSLARAQVTENATTPSPPAGESKTVAEAAPPKPVKPKLPDAATAKKQIQALYNEVNRLAKKREHYAVKQHFLTHTTDDYVQKEKNGKKTSREDAAEIVERSIFAVGKFTTVVSKITSLTIKGSDVIVVYNDLTAFLTPGPPGQAQRVSVTSTTRDTWVKTEEGWKTRYSETLSQKMLVNGKPPRFVRRPRGHVAGEDDAIDAIAAWSLGGM